MPLSDAKLRTLKPESKPRKFADFEGLSPDFTSQLSQYKALPTR